MKQSEVIEKVTKRVFEIMETGETIPWNRPWMSIDKACQNFTTGKAYNGINAFILSLMSGEFDGCPYFATFDQFKSKNITVNQKGYIPVIFFSWLEKEDEETGEEKAIPFFKYFRVFSLLQTDSAQKWEEEKDSVLVNKNFQNNDQADLLINQYAEKMASITNKQQGRACYSPSSDTITLPLKAQFPIESQYYATVFHEMVHSTGHSSRLSRSGVTNPTKFGSHEYSQEELVAEMGSFALMHYFNIPVQIDNQASYIRGWMKALKDNPKYLVWASGQAEKAVNFIIESVK